MIQKLFFLANRPRIAFAACGLALLVPGAAIANQHTSADVLNTAEAEIARGNIENARTMTENVVSTASSFPDQLRARIILATIETKRNNPNNAAAYALDYLQLVRTGAPIPADELKKDFTKIFPLFAEAQNWIGLKMISDYTQLHSLPLPWRANEKGAFYHLASGIKFPANIGPLKRERVVIIKPDWSDLSVRYASPERTNENLYTLFLGFAPELTLRLHAEKYARRGTPGVFFDFTPMKASVSGVRYVASEPAKSADKPARVTETYVVAKNGWHLKLRASHYGTDAEKAELQNFIDNIRWP